MILQELAFPSRQEPLLRKKMRPSFLRYCEINIILIKWINREGYEFSKKNIFGQFGWPEIRRSGGRLRLKVRKKGEKVCMEGVCLVVCY